MTKGFFSVVVILLGMIFLISFLYAQQSRDNLNSESENVMIAQQMVFKDWAMARNAYTNFAADAMVSGVVDTSVVSCTAPVDYAPFVVSYWLDTRDYLLSLGVDCVAELDSPATQVLNDQRANALLTCSRTIGDVDFSITHPFVIRKRVIVASALPNCTVSVYENLGIDGTGILDVQHTFSP